MWLNFEVAQTQGINPSMHVFAGQHECLHVSCMMDATSMSPSIGAKLSKASLTIHRDQKTTASSKSARNNSLAGFLLSGKSPRYSAVASARTSDALSCSSRSAKTKLNRCRARAFSCLNTRLPSKMRRASARWCLHFNPTLVSLRLFLDSGWRHMNWQTYSASSVLCSRRR